MIDGFGWGRDRSSWLFVAALAGAGCGDTTDGRATPNPVPVETNATPQSLDEFAQNFAASFCQSIAGCCTRQGFPMTDCQSTLVGQVRAQLQVSASSPKIRFNSQAASKCIAAYATALAACTNEAAFAQTDDACDDLLEGTVAIGGECGRSAECAPSDQGSVNCTTGVCVLVQPTSSLLDGPHRKLGESCAGTCEKSAGCSGSISTGQALGSCWVEDGVVCSNGVCVRAPQVGEACNSASYCDAAAHCVAGRCVADVSRGPCTQDNQCLSPTTCDYTLQMCVPLKQNGEACDQSDQCLGGQCYEDHCRTWTVARADSCLGVLDD